MNENGTTSRILPQYEHIDGTDQLREAIMQALGAASVSWEPMDCTGVFDSRRCEQIGEELMVIGRQWADGRDCGCACHDPNPVIPGVSELHESRWRRWLGTFVRKSE